MLTPLFVVYLPARVRDDVFPDLLRFGSLVITSQILSYVSDAETHTPHLKTWDSWGRRIDHLVTSEGWRRLQELGIREGIVAIAHENAHAEASRVVQFLKYHIWTGSSAIVTCPSAMTDGAARLLSEQLKRLANSNTNEDKVKMGVLQDALRRLTSRDTNEAWTSGQWMTERTGGSDVRETETLAHLLPLADEASTVDVNGNPLGPWRVDGFKWFSSATDANMTVLLARTSSGLSLFFAPMRRATTSHQQNVDDSSQSELNGVHIQRLKTKLGTKALPTAELELQNMRAWLLGEEGKGTKEISTVLNITRIHTALSSVGLWGRGLAISRSFAKVRRSSGKLLKDIPSHVATMANEHIDYRANMHLAFFTVALLGLSEQNQDARSAAPALKSVPEPMQKSSELLLRLLTPIVKAITAKASIKGLQECMESLGGVGYLDQEDMSTNIARLYRDANVLAIWEGTTNVLGADVVRVVKGRTGPAILKTLEDWILACCQSWETLWKAEASRLTQNLSSVLQVISRKDGDELNYGGRSLMDRIAWIVCGVLLVEDARMDKDDISTEIAQRWVGCNTPAAWNDIALWDRRIVFGKEADDGAAKL